jgi:hypothetical protein
MKVNNAVQPTPEQMQGFLDPDAVSPIFMLNMLRFKDRAEYADGRETDLSGAEAYAIYSAGVSELIKEFGGYLGFVAQVERLMLGEVEDLWDQVGIAMYPDRAAMLAMIQTESYQELHVHRDAGLAGQLNIETNSALGQWLDPV